MSLIRFDYRGALHPGYGVTKQLVSSQSEKLAALRDEVLASFAEQPPGSYFSLPQQQLAAYAATRELSDLGRIFAVANSLHDHLDAVVVLGNRESLSGPRAVFQACCDPYHNEQSRAARGSKPRMYFGGDSFDNDSSAALAERLVAGGYGDSPADRRWAIIVIDHAGDHGETEVALQRLLEILRKQLGQSATTWLPRLVIPVTALDSPLRQLAREIGCNEVFEFPEHLADLHSVLSNAGLLPAAMLGLDCMRFLQGAVAMNEHFLTARFDENVVLQFVAVSHALASVPILAERADSMASTLCVWNEALLGIEAWYGRIASRSHSFVIHNLVIQDYRHDHHLVRCAAGVQDSLRPLDGRSMPQLMSSATQQINEMRHSCGRPTTNIVLPHIDTHTLGQLFQMLMIATTLQSRLSVQDSSLPPQNSIHVGN